MPRFFSVLCLVLLLVNCQNGSKEQKVQNENVSEEKDELTTVEKIANAHGFAEWDQVNKLKFTFNVDAGGNHSERSWIWMPKTNDVTMITANDTLNYNRAAVDSISLNADKAFINDKFWLLAPFQLVWDKGTKIKEPVKSIAPVSNKELNKMTLTYIGDGGYTPGDAYDFYYNDDFKVEEWVYRKGNSTEPSMTTTFENYEDFKGIKIAKDHKNLNGDWNLYFTDIEIN